MKINLQTCCLLICIFSSTAFGLKPQNDLFSKDKVIANQDLSNNFNNLWYGYKCVAINSKIPIEAEFALKADLSTQENATNISVKIITHGENANSQFQFKIDSQILTFDQFGINFNDDKQMVRGDYNDKAFTVFVPKDHIRFASTADFFDGAIIIIALDKKRHPLRESYAKFETKCYHIISRSQPSINLTKIEE